MGKLEKLITCILLSANATYATTVVASFVTSFQIPIGDDRARTCLGITYFGNNFYLVDSFNWRAPIIPRDPNYPRIIKLTTTGSIVAQDEAPAKFLNESNKGKGGTKGLTYDGTYFWMIEVDGSRFCYNFTPGSKSIISSFATPNTKPRGLSWDGTYLWEVDCISGIVYQLTTAGSVVDSFQAFKTDGERFFGVAYDGLGGYIYVGKYGENDGFECYDLNNNYARVGFTAMPEGPYTALYRHPKGMTTFAEDELWVVDANTDSFVKIRILFN